MMKRVYIDIHFMDEDYKVSYFDGLVADSPAALIMEAAACNKDIKNLSRILQIEQMHGLMPDFANSHGLTPLMAAVVEGNADVADHICRHPLTYLNRKDARGMTALHHAVRTGNRAMAEMLLLHKADVSITDENGRTPLHLAQDDDMRAVLTAKSLRRNRTRPSTGFDVAQRQQGAELPVPSAPVQIDGYKGLIESLKKDPASAYTALSKSPATDFLRLCRENSDVMDTARWNALFSDIVMGDRIDLLKIWHAERDLPNKKVLQDAIMISNAGGGENRDAVIYELLMMGANPFANNMQAAEGTVIMNHADRFTLMAQFSQHLPKADALNDFKYDIIESIPDSHMRRQFREAADIIEKRISLRKNNQHKTLLREMELCVTFNSFSKAISCYQEGRVQRFFSGALNWHQHTDLIKRLMLYAYMDERLDVVTMLERDGHSLKGMDPADPTYQRVLRNRKGYKYHDRIKALVEGTVETEPLVPYQERERQIMQKIRQSQATLIGSGVWRRTL